MPLNYIKNVYVATDVLPILHLPIKKKAWYWKILKKKEFSKIPKIIEYRNCDIKKIKESINFLSRNS